MRGNAKRIGLAMRGTTQKFFRDFSGSSPEKNIIKLGALS
jgi:hypothetical protein